MLSDQELESFRALVRRRGAEHARDYLPWRYLDDPYAVYVSEVMLQQTQVQRVLSFWQRWIKALPSVDAVASAATSDVLMLWQGLGYNRRALALKQACELCAQRYAGSIPSAYEDLIALPGIGPATAAGIRAFAYNQPATYLETNVRTVFLHTFFADRQGVADSELVPYVEQACDLSDPRGWYYALLDYGHYLKSVVPNPSRKSASYARQSAFEGSHRQKRAFLLREALSLAPVSLVELRAALDEFECRQGRSALEEGEFLSLVDELSAEGFFAVRDDMVVL